MECVGIVGVYMCEGYIGILGVYMCEVSRVGIVGVYNSGCVHV